MTDKIKKIIARKGFRRTDINKLPDDIREMIKVIENGEMPNLAGLLKYDFRKIDYLLFGIGAGIFGLWFFWVTLDGAIEMIKTDTITAGILGGIMLGFFAYQGLKFSIINLILFKESTRGRTYVLLTNKYLLIREGWSISYYEWHEIYLLKVIGMQSANEVWWDRIRFIYKDISVALVFNHLSSKSRLFLAEQINRYWQRFGGKAVLISQEVKTLGSKDSKKGMI